LGRALAHGFVASLRMPKPQPVNVNIPSFGGAGVSRQLQNMIGAMLSGTVNVSQDEPDQPAATAEAAAKLAGFPARLPRARSERLDPERGGARVRRPLPRRRVLRRHLAVRPARPLNARGAWNPMHIFSDGEVELLPS
jgi:hypothetical protein